MKDPESESTEELRADQEAREHIEEELADHAPDEASELEHRRRAEKAAYLSRKLAVRARSEREAAEEDADGTPGQEIR